MNRCLLHSYLFVPLCFSGILLRNLHLKCELQKSAMEDSGSEYLQSFSGGNASRYTSNSFCDLSTSSMNMIQL